MTKLERHGPLILYAIFIVLCLIHYFSFRPLWLDENFLLINLQQYSGLELMRPLDHAQVFPRIHLIIIQKFAALFDYHVGALRIFSLAAMLTAFWIWMRIFKTHPAVVLVVLAMTGAYKMSYFAAEFKSYAMDVLVVGLFCRYFMGSSETPENKNRMIAGIILLPGLVFFSYAAILVSWIIPWNLLIDSIRNRKGWGLFYLSLILTVVMGGTIYFTDLRHSIGLKALQDYWAGAFISTCSIGDFFDTFGDGIKKIVTAWYGPSPMKNFIRFMVIGVPFFLYALIRYGWGKWRNDHFKVLGYESLALILMLELFVLGMLHKYPFTGERLTLFLAPMAMALTVFGMNDVKKPSWLRYALLGYFTGYCLVSLINTIIQLVKLVIPA